MSRAIHKMGMGSSLPVEISATYSTTVDSAGGTASRTHAAFNVGGAGTKFLLGVLSMGDASTGLGISTFELGGVTMTVLEDHVHDNGSEFLRSYIFGADISSLSGSQSWTLWATQGIDASALDAIVVTGLQSLTPIGTVKDLAASSALDLPITGTANGITIAGACNVNRTYTETWATVTERSGLATGTDISDIRHTAAWDVGLVTLPSSTCTWSSSGTSVGCAAVLR